MMLAVAVVDEDDDADADDVDDAQWMDGRKHGRMDAWTDGRTDRGSS